MHALKKYFFITIIFILLASGCSSNSSQEESRNYILNDMVYFVPSSWSGDGIIQDDNTVRFFKNNSTLIFQFNADVPDISDIHEQENFARDFSKTFNGTYQISSNETFALRPAFRVKGSGEYDNTSYNYDIIVVENLDAWYCIGLLSDVNDNFDNEFEEIIYSFYFSNDTNEVDDSDSYSTNHDMLIPQEPDIPDFSSVSEALSLESLDPEPIFDGEEVYGMYARFLMSPELFDAITSEDITMFMNDVYPQIRDTADDTDGVVDYTYTLITDGDRCVYISNASILDVGHCDEYGAIIDSYGYYELIDGTYEFIENE